MPIEVISTRFIRRRIYLASSWRNLAQPGIVRMLEVAGHDVYDFRNPGPGNTGFRWTEIDPEWKSWTAETFRTALGSSLAELGFRRDYEAMRWADTGIMLLPCGRSAHLEAGYFVGVGKPLYILLLEGMVPATFEPELMYKLATKVCLSMDELWDSIGFKGDKRP